ncbi:MAG: TonB family protein [Deltaproteobacteria bacterium]|nr:TonB family protein [Deltaproteobacteria bacterium]
MTDRRWIGRTLLMVAALSLLLHGVVGVILWQLLWHHEARLREARLAALAAQEMELVYLTLPANQIRPSRARAVGKEDNTTSRETVARVAQRAPQTPPAAKPETPSRSHAEEPPGEALTAPQRRRRLPATAVVKTYGGAGPMSHLPEDYFPDYRHGGHTYINVLRHPGVDYFVEIKQSVSVAWNPRPALEGHFQTLAAHGGIRTVLGVAIAEDGALHEAFVLKSSGVQSYDREALRAFRSTFPFFRPPKSLLSLDGEHDQLLRMSVSFHVVL